MSRTRIPPSGLNSPSGFPPPNGTAPFNPTPPNSTPGAFSADPPVTQGDYQLTATRGQGKSLERTLIWGWATDTLPMPTSGFGGSQPLDRPKKPSLTTWQGRQPFQFPLEMILRDNARPIKKLIHDLITVASAERPELVWTIKLQGQRGHLAQIPHTGREWTIEDIQWGDGQLNSDWLQVMQVATLILQEVVRDQDLASSTLSYRVNSKGHKIVRIHHVTKEDVKPGHGLPWIAKETLHDPNRWPDIAALNHLRSSGQLKVGMVLRLP